MKGITKMKLTKSIIERINSETNCTITDEEDYYTIFVDNQCDEDYRLEIDKSDDEIEEIIRNCEGFDSEEHFKLWYGANNVEPSNPRTLLDNCEEIEENLQGLADLLRGLR